MSWPHPLDYAWRPFTGDYFKLHYDVRVKNPDGTTTVTGPHWPNGGQIRVGERSYGPGECEIRVCEKHPWGGAQLTGPQIKLLIAVYGQPPPEEWDRLLPLLDLV